MVAATQDRMSLLVAQPKSRPFQSTGKSMTVRARPEVFFVFGVSAVTELVVAKFVAGCFVQNACPIIIVPAALETTLQSCLKPATCLVLTLSLKCLGACARVNTQVSFSLPGSILAANLSSRTKITAVNACCVRSASR